MTALETTLQLHLRVYQQIMASPKLIETDLFQWNFHMFPYVSLQKWPIDHFGMVGGTTGSTICGLTLNCACASVRLSPPRPKQVLGTWAKRMGCGGRTPVLWSHSSMGTIWGTPKMCQVVQRMGDVEAINGVRKAMENSIFKMPSAQQTAMAQQWLQRKQIDYFILNCKLQAC